MATQARGRPLKFHTSQWEGMVFSVWRQSVRRITDTHVLIKLLIAIQKHSCILSGIKTQSTITLVLKLLEVHAHHPWKSEKNRGLDNHSFF